MNFYKQLSNYKKVFFSLSIIIAILIFSNRLLLQNVVYESDDYKLHAVRIANYYLALKQGQLPVRWGPNLNGGYGYPSFNYMYHIPYMIGSTLHVLGLSIQQSLNTSVLLALLLGATSCYFLLGSYLKSEKWKILLSLFFICNPYTLLNVYWRGAIGELFFYAVVPLFLLGVKKISHKHSLFYFLVTTLTFFLLVLSHLPSLLLLLVLLLVFLFTELQGQFTWKKIMPVIFACIMGLLLSSCYWIPAYFEQWMIIYKTVGSLTQYQTQFITLKTLFNFQSSAHSSALFSEVIQIGSIPVLAMLIAICFQKLYKKAFPWLLLLLTSIFCITNYSFFLWNTVVLLQYIQFPWRFAWLVVMSTLFILIQFILEKSIQQKWKLLFACILVIALACTVTGYSVSKGTNNRSDFEWYHPTSETGSSFNEHLPIWAQTAYYFPTELLYVSASEAAALKPENQKNSVHELAELQPIIQQFDGRVISYQITPPQDIVILHKRLYFPGWQASVNDEPTEFLTDIPQYKGILAIPVSASSSSRIKIEFNGYTKLRRFSEFLSVTAALFLLVFIIIKKYKIRKHATTT